MSDLTCWKLEEAEMGESGIKIYQVAIMIPTMLFLLVLLLTLRRFASLFRSSSFLVSPVPSVVKVYYAFVWGLALAAAMACLVSFVHPDSVESIVFWVILLQIYLFVELSILVFLLHGSVRNGLFSIRISMGLTLLVTVCYGIVQIVLQFVFGWNITGHDSSSIFYWLARGIFFFLIYLVIVILPYTSLKEVFPLPARVSFYRYIYFLLFVNLLLIIGCLLAYFYINSGYCILGVSSYLYLTIFPPAIFLTYLVEYYINTRKEDEVVYDTINAAYEESAVPEASEGFDSSTYRGGVRTNSPSSGWSETSKKFDSDATPNSYLSVPQSSKSSKSRESLGSPTSESFHISAGSWRDH